MAGWQSNFFPLLPFHSTMEAVEALNGPFSQMLRGLDRMGPQLKQFVVKHAMT